MTRRERLSDLQLILLASAARRDNASLLPLVPPVDDDERTRRALRALLRKRLITEAPAGTAPGTAMVHPDHNAPAPHNPFIATTDEAGEAGGCDERHRTGFIITDAGREAIGVVPEETAADADGTGERPEDPDPEPGPATAHKGIAGGAPGDDIAPSPTPKTGSKQAVMLDLLHRPEGATLAELTEATGWQPHSARAALTGLRQRGHAIVRDKRDGTTCYRVTEAA